MLRLTTLGALTLEYTDGRLPGVGARRRSLALLAFVAANAHGASRDKVLAYFWPESDLVHARNCLKQMLFALRRELGRELFLSSGGPTLRLDPRALTVDHREFIAALHRGARRDAVAAYGGPFLDGFHLNNLPEFEQWVEVERGLLANRYQSALEGLVVEAEAADDRLRAVEWWRRLAEHDPLSSRVAVGLMRALVAIGDRAGALRHAERHEELVYRELETRPDTGELILVQQLRARALDQPRI